MKKFFNVIDKILRTIIVLPFAILGGAACGLLYLLTLAIQVPVAVIIDIWEDKHE